MKKCPKCHGECMDDAKSCPLCGYEFTDQENKIQTEESLKADSSDTVETNIESNIEETQEPVLDSGSSAEDVTAKPSNRNKFIVFGAALLGLIVIIVICLNSVLGKTKKMSPEDTVIEAYKEMSKAKTYHAVSEVEFETFDMLTQDVYTDNIAEKVIQDLSFKVEYQYHKENLQLQADIDILLRDTSLTTIQLYLDKELVTIQIPLLHDKPFLITWDGVFNKIKEETGEDINYKSYLTLFDLENYDTYNAIEFTNYENIFKTFLTEKIEDIGKATVELGDKSSKLSRYTLTYDYEDSITLIADIADEILKDEKVKAFIFEVIDKASSLVIENEDYPEYLTEEEFTASIQELKDEYDSYIESLGDNSILSEIFGYEGADLNEIFDQMNVVIQQDMYVDKNSHLKKVELTQTIEQLIDGMVMSMTVKADTIYDLDSKLDFIEVDRDNVVDILNMSEQELEDLLYEIQGNVTSQVITNPIFSQFMDGSMNE